MLGAGGLKFIDPLYQRVIVQECRERGIPVVFDEVHTYIRTYAFLIMSSSTTLALALPLFLPLSIPLLLPSSTPYLSHGSTTLNFLFLVSFKIRIQDIRSSDFCVMSVLHIWLLFIMAFALASTST
jgi:hypothetical protein